MYKNPKAQEFYDVFYRQLPEYLRENIDEQESAKHDCLPLICSSKDANRVLSALKRAYSIYLPDAINPYESTLKNQPEARKGLDNLYLSEIYLLSTYWPKDNNLQTLARMAYRATRLWPEHASFFDQKIEEIKYGALLFRDYTTNYNHPKNSALYNHFTGTFAKDYERDMNGELSSRKDRALCYYQKFRLAQKKLDEKNSTININAMARLPFAYLGHTEQFANDAAEEWCTNRMRDLMRSDELTAAAKMLRKVYDEALENQRGTDLFAQMRIESLFTFLEDPGAKATQKDKYFVILKGAVMDFAKAAAPKAGNADIYQPTLFDEAELMHIEEANHE